MRRVITCTLALGFACGGSQKSSTAELPELDVQTPWVDPTKDYPQPRTPPPDAPDAAPSPIAIRGATILTAAGERIEGGTIVLRDGRIAYVGAGDAPVPEGAELIDGSGKFVTPGLIDSHSHIGVYSQPTVSPHSDVNEMTAPVTAQVRAEWGYWPQDPAIPRAAAGGVTTLLVLPGSANLIGGHGVTMTARLGRSADEVMFPGAPQTLKMACGENPKRVYGSKGGPETRMAEYAWFRHAFEEAAEYRAKQRAYLRARSLWEKKRARARELEESLAKQGTSHTFDGEEAPSPPSANAKLEYLAQVLDGEVLVQVHCYKASDIREMVDLAREFGFHIRSIHHALGAYKVRDLLVAEDTAISTWSDWWGFKMEAFDGIVENAALFTESGGRAVIHSDSPTGIQRLNQEAAKAMYAGHAAGIEITEDQALRWITANPAWVLGIDDETGTLEPGKRADVVLWSGHPFSVYALPELVLAAGAVTYRREDGLQPSDFELGNSAIDAPAQEVTR